MRHTAGGRVVPVVEAKSTQFTQDVHQSMAGKIQRVWTKYRYRKGVYVDGMNILRWRAKVSAGSVRMHSLRFPFINGGVFRFDNARSICFKSSQPTLKCPM